MMNQVNTVPEENIIISQSEKLGFHLSVQQIISLSPPLPKTVSQEIAQFWQQRRVIFSEISDNVLLGKRGSLWWNAITFDMSKLRADLTIHLDKEKGTIRCLLDVKTTLQQITPMNQQYWVEEMVAFKSFLQSGDEKKEEWEEFKEEYRKANRHWVWGFAITAGIAVIVSQMVGGLMTWLLSLFSSSK